MFLHGRPGVGKLTVGKELAKRTGYRLFHNHLTVDLATSVFDFGTPAFVDLREHVWLEVFGRAAEEDVSLIFTFAAESTVGETFVERAREAIERMGGEILFVELCCDAEELERRVESPGRLQFGKLASAEELRALGRDGTLLDLEVPRAARAIRLDTTSLDAGAAAAEIVARLGLARVA